MATVGVYHGSARCWVTINGDPGDEWKCRIELLDSNDAILAVRVLADHGDLHARHTFDGVPATVSWFRVVQTNHLISKGAFDIPANVRPGDVLTVQVDVNMDFI